MDRNHGGCCEEPRRLEGVQEHEAAWEAGLKIKYLQQHLTFTENLCARSYTELPFEIVARKNNIEIATES